jgi:hypothetical protein
LNVHSEILGGLKNELEALESCVAVSDLAIVPKRSPCAMGWWCAHHLVETPRPDDTDAVVANGCKGVDNVRVGIELSQPVRVGTHKIKGGAIDDKVLADCMDEIVGHGSAWLENSGGGDRGARDVSGAKKGSRGKQFGELHCDSV